MVRVVEHGHQRSEVLAVSDVNTYVGVNDCFSGSSGMPTKPRGATRGDESKGQSGSDPIEHRRHLSVSHQLAK